MTITRSTKGIVFTCGDRGIVKRILHDTFGLKDHLMSGHPLPFQVDRGSLTKALDLLRRIRSKGSVFSHQLTLQVDGVLKSMYFSGAETDGNLLIAAAETSHGAMRLYERFLHMIHDQSTWQREWAFEQGCHACDRMKPMTVFMTNLAA